CRCWRGPRRQPSSTISRAARRTNSERKSPASPCPSINAFKRSRVRSDAGILSIGVLLRQRPVARPDLVDSPIRRRCTPTLFPAILGLHPGPWDNLILITLAEPYVCAAGLSTCEQAGAGDRRTATRAAPEGYH